MSVWFDFDEVDAFTVGALGQPGARTFFLQVRRGATTVSIRCEKQQAAAIAEFLRRVLSDLPEPADQPAQAAMRLDEPVEAAFVLGPVGLGYDRATDKVLVQLDEVPDDDNEGDDDEGGDDEDRGHVRLFLSRGQAAAFCGHADNVVSAGRPSCRWCGRPIDPDGHRCIRMN